MNTGDDPTIPFPDTLRAIGEAWADLEEAGRIAATDPAAAQSLLAGAVARAGGNPHLLVRAGDLLAGWGREAAARDLLATGLEPDAPIAPLQFAYARRLRTLGDLEGARRWFRGGLLCAMPDAERVLELAAIEEGGTVEVLLRIAMTMPCQNPARLIDTGRRLRDEGRIAFAYAAFTAASRRGHRDAAFLAEFTALAAQGGIAIADPAHDRHIAALAAHAKLAASCDREELFAVPRAREASDRWVPLDRLPDFLGARIATGRPFSWIRLSDGEGRFLLHGHAGLRPALTEAEAQAVARLIWFNWFGQDIGVVDPARLADLTSRLDTAILNADLLGIPSVLRLREDPSHFGYCAAVEMHVRHLLGHGGDTYFTEALFTYPMNEADPFLGRLLGGRDFLGVVSPHPELAARLGRHLGIATTVSYDIPGETRLGRAREATDRGRHFPEVFDDILARLAVPYPGAVFIVAGGLLGKIYCDRIRALGGIALDIGAIVDAWMGINSRGSSLDRAMGAVLPGLANPAPLG